jgi:8-hydroxy-5-deazaflavin:NADPH oxidoreductase
MKVAAVLGTGMVGQAQAAKLAELGHDVLLGTRNPDSKQIKGLKVVSYAAAAKHGEVIFEAIKGEYVVKTLKSLATELEGKLLIDISNALDFSSGEVKITTANGPSLGEQIQTALPKTNVVKAFNTINASVQVAPQSLAGGDHHLFIAGNDQTAKDQFIKIAKTYGWQNIIDLGDIKAARGMEMLMPFWLDLRKKLGHSSFNYKIST